MPSDSVVCSASQFALHMMLPSHTLEYTVFGYILSRGTFINRELDVSLHPESACMVSTGEIADYRNLLNECTSTV